MLSDLEIISSRPEFSFASDTSDVFIFVTLGITWHCTCLDSFSFAFSCGCFQLLSFHVFAENVLIGMVLSSCLPEPQRSTASSGCPPTGKPRAWKHCTLECIAWHSLLGVVESWNVLWESMLCYHCSATKRWLIGGVAEVFSCQGEFRSPTSKTLSWAFWSLEVRVPRDCKQLQTCGKQIWNDVSLCRLVFRFFHGPTLVD